jgi:negative regulator of genetic competence, sporulation and motility
MHIEEVEQYKVACHVSRKDLKSNGITVEDIVNRTPLGHMFFKKAGELAKESTAYEWPGCAMSLQMEFYPEDIVLYFSERIDDYVYSLRQTAMALPEDQQESMNRLIEMITMSEEDVAREFIRNFERNVREVQE